MRTPREAGYRPRAARPWARPGAPATADAAARTAVPAGTLRRLVDASPPAGIRRLMAAAPANIGALTVAALIGVFMLTFALRALFIDRAYDVFTDEVTYLALSRGIVAGHGVLLYGHPFFLHPPLFFLVEGIYTDILRPAGPLIDQVLGVRALNVLLAAATDVVLFAIAWRTVGLRTALVVAVLFAVDPFVIRINSRNLLETSTMLWVVLGYLVLISGNLGVGRHLSGRRVLLAGVLFGCAILTKEMAVFLTLVPLAVAFATGWAITRRQALAIMAISAAVYAIYPATIVVSGLGPEWLTQKASGLMRFLGLVKSTGFVPSGGPSFLAAVVRNADVFAMTYLLIGLGIPACLILLRDPRPRLRLLGILCGSAYALLAYSVALGTLEEQFFYYLGVPAILSVPIAAASLLTQPSPRQGVVGDRAEAMPAAGVSEPAGRRRARRWLDRPRSLAPAAVRQAAPVFLAVAVAWSLYTWGQIHLTPDNGYEQVRAYLRRHVQSGATIGITTEPQDFVLDGYRLAWIDSTTDIRQSNAQYAIVSTKQIEDGYMPHGASVYAWLRANATPVYVFSGRTYGRLEVYRIGSPGS